MLQIFLVDYRDLTSWMGDLDQRITNGELANNVKDAQALLDLHRERKVNVNNSYNLARMFTHILPFRLFHENVKDAHHNRDNFSPYPFSMLK